MPGPNLVAHVHLSQELSAETPLDFRSNVPTVTNNSNKLCVFKLLIPQASAVRRLVSFQSDQSRAVVLWLLWIGGGPSSDSLQGDTASGMYSHWLAGFSRL